MGEELQTTPGSSATSASLPFHTLLDNISTSIEILGPVRKNNTIVDFEYLYLNQAAKRRTGDTAKLGKKFLMVPGNTKILFRKIVKSIETGISFQSLIFKEQHDGMHWLHEEYTRVEDFVIICREDVTDTAFQQTMTITDATHDAIIITDCKGKISYWNMAAADTYGYSSDEALGKKINELAFVDENSADLKDAMSRVCQDGEPVSGIITKKRKKDGKLFDVIMNLRSMKDGTGLVTGICLVSKDISETRKAKEKTREDAHFIGQIVDTTSDVIYIMDLNTLQLIYTNRQHAIDLGYSKEQISQMKNPIFDIMHPEDLPVVKEHIKSMKTLTTGDNIVESQFRLRDVNGVYKWFCDRSTVFKRNAGRMPVEKIGICQDISDSKKQEEQKRTSQDLLGQVEELTGMGSWEYDIETANFKWSKGMYKLFNLHMDLKPEPEIYFDYTSEDDKDKVKLMIDNIRNNYRDFEEVIALLPAGGGNKTVKIKAVVTKDAKNNPVKITGVALDVSTQVKFDEEISVLNRSLTKKNEDLETLNKELKTFNSVIAQDFKEALQTLYTNLEYITRTEATQLQDSSKANIRRAQSAIQKMNLLTSDINRYLQLYDIGVNISMINPNQVLQGVISGMKGRLEENNARIDTIEMPGLFADPLLFSMLLTQLIDNAIKFRKLVISPVIRIRYSQADELNAVDGARPNTPYAIISISDNGIGFDENDAEKIFDPFIRLAEKTKYKGSGLGLAICKKIMTMHEGMITAEGSLANGATFNCYFPMRKQG